MTRGRIVKNIVVVQARVDGQLGLREWQQRWREMKRAVMYCWQGRRDGKGEEKSKYDFVALNTGEE